MPETGKQTPLWDFPVLVIALSHAHVAYIAYIRVTSGRATGKGWERRIKKRMQFYRLCQGFQVEYCFIPR